MTIHLRDLADGARFVLLRTGEKYALIRREKYRGRNRIVVRREYESTDSELHHSCHVKPVIRVTP